MACLIRRHNGIFYIVTCEKGKRVWRSLHTENQLEANEHFAEIERDRRRKERNLISSYVQEFLEAAPLNYSQNTIGLYRGIFKTFVRIIGDRPMASLSLREVEIFKQNRFNEVSAVSVNIELRMLRAAFSFGQKLGYIENNPFHGVRLVRVPFKEAGYLSERDFHRLLRVVDDPEFRDLIKFATFTMMRRGEIINTRWVDIDLERKEIHVRAHDGFEPKSKRPRVIPMSGWVYDFLASRLRRSQYVFSNRKGEQLAHGMVTHRFKRYVRRAALREGIHFHSLRHTGISWLINKGVPQPFVQRLAGHSSPIVTQIYTHLEDKNLVTAINAFPSLN